MNLTRFFNVVFVSLGLFGLYVAVGVMDYKDAEQYQEFSCKMVEEGTWPKDFCPDGK